MSLRIIGKGGAVLQTDKSHRALRATVIPPDSGQLDHYIASFTYDPTVDLANTGTIASFHNRGLDGRVAVLHKIDVSFAHKTTNVSNAGGLGIGFNRQSVRHRYSTNTTTVTPVACYPRQGMKVSTMECFVLSAGFSSMSFPADVELTPSNSSDLTFAYAGFSLGTAAAQNCTTSRATVFGVRSPWDQPVVLMSGEIVRAVLDGSPGAGVRVFMNFTFHWFECTVAQAAALGFA